MIGQQFYNYQIVSLVGEGGMGKVYLAVHNQLGRKVAIKVLDPYLARNPEIRARFKKEAATLANLQHPNIVTLFDYAEDGDTCALIMEYVEGQALDDYIQKVTGPIPESRLIPLFSQMLQGVSYAHSRGVIHRDIKPSNFIVTSDGQVKILDFGIAKILDEGSHKLTRTGTRMGTILYMSPEQVKGTEVDVRTDVYALGVTLFQMVTARCPYDENLSEYQVYKMIAEEPLPDPAFFYPALSPRIKAIINKAASKEPSDRYQTCDEFLAAIEQAPKPTADIPPPVNKLMDAIPEQAQAVPEEQPAAIPMQEVVKSSSRKKLRVTLFSVLFLVVIIGGALFAYYKFFTREAYVLATVLNLRNSMQDETTTNVIARMNYGEKVYVLGNEKTKDAKGLQWVRIYVPGQGNGYVAQNYLGSYEDVQRLNGLWGNRYAQEKTNVRFKKALLNYFSGEKKYERTKWKLFGANPGQSETKILSADFNNDGKADFACILQNLISGESLLLVFITTEIDQTRLVYEGAFKGSASMEVATAGKSYFLGRYEQSFSLFDGWVRKPRKDKLSTNGILLSGYKINYVGYLDGEQSFRFFEQ